MVSIVPIDVQDTSEEVEPIVTPRKILAPAAPLREAPIPRLIELIRFSYMSIGSIDCIEQKFRAQVFFELRFPGGCLDPDLNADGCDFPTPVDGRLPRPPAGWFMNQIDLKNYFEHRDPLNATKRRQGNDIILSMRFEGDVRLHAPLAPLRYMLSKACTHSYTLGTVCKHPRVPAVF